ncbi:MAG: four-carbon acid sugar kinase family protein [Coraliomargaritaceae bacterium]
MKLVILDDDPTGTQTVKDLPVLTVWDKDSLAREFENPAPAFFILTNTRAMPRKEAGDIVQTIARNLKQAAGSIPFTVISRSDSTLRGHFPLETDLLNENLGPFQATLFIPYFEAGGRVTIKDVHYIREGNDLTPVAKSPFAKDPAFGFTASNLKDFIVEKTNGGVHRSAVVSVQTGLNPNKIAELLIQCSQGSYVIVNAECREDLDVFCQGLSIAEQSGCRYLFRTAAEFVRCRLGQAPNQALETTPFRNTNRGGLIVAGSYVPKTTEQLEFLTRNADLETIELDVATILRGEIDYNIIKGQICLHLDKGRNVLLMTSRELIQDPDPDKSLQIGQKISTTLVEVVRSLPKCPAWILAKGGITSSDIATDSLGIQRAQILGQIIPGVPVWLSGGESYFPGLPFIVFPGNVGSQNSLLEVVELANSFSQSC